MPKKPVDHYDDNPPDEGEDYNGPEIDYTNPMKFDENSLSEYSAAMSNVSKRAGGGKGSRSRAAGRMINNDPPPNSDIEVR